MIHSVKKVAEGRYVLNDSLILHDIDYGDEGLTYNFSYDEKVITEKESQLIIEEFLSEAFNNE